VVERLELLCHILKVIGLNSTAVQCPQLFNPIVANSEHKNECYGATEFENCSTNSANAGFSKGTVPYIYLGQEELMTRNKAKYFIDCGRSGLDLIH
jgi:hypothetical protein